MMEATTERAVQDTLDKQVPRDVSDDDIFKPRNQPITEAIITESHVEKVRLACYIFYRDCCKCVSVNCFEIFLVTACHSALTKTMLPLSKFL